MSTKKGQLKFKDIEGTITPFLPAGLFDVSNIDETTAKEIRRQLGVYKNIVFDECERNWSVYGTPKVETDGLVFDGASYVKTLSAIGGANPFTVECYAKASVEHSASSYGPMSVCCYGDDNNVFSFIYNTSDHMAFNVKMGGNWKIQGVYTQKSPVNTFRHLAISYDGTKIYCFVDGELIHTATATVTSKAYHIFLGNGNTLLNGWKGTIDDKIDDSKTKGGFF